jgi:hypothetical protein
VEAVAFAPDGRTVATGSWDRTVRLWDVASGSQLHKLIGHNGGIKCVAFSPNGEILASGGGEEHVRLWKADSGKPLAQLGGHAGVVLALAFTPDGAYLATGDGQGKVRLWDASTGKEVRRLEGHRGIVSALAATPDGRLLCSASIGSASFELRPMRSEPIALGAGGSSGVSADLSTVWDDLASPDARVALRAQRALASDPEGGLRVLARHLKPAQPIDAQMVAALVAQLTQPDRNAHRTARQTILELGTAVEIHLEQMLGASRDGKAATVLRELLDELRVAPPSPEALRGMRAVTFLGRCKLAGARTLLEALARGAPEALLTQEARAALDRWQPGK